MFKKIKFGKILKKLLAFFAPTIAELLSKWTEKGRFELNELLTYSYERDAAMTTHLLVIAYPFIDTIVEDWAKKTSNPYDDKIVSEIKSVVENFAVLKGINLPNIDAD